MSSALSRSFSSGNSSEALIACCNFARHIGRHVLRPEHREPEAQIDVGVLDAGLFQRRYLRQCRRARLAGDGEALDAIGVDQRLCHLARRQRQVDVAGDQVGHGRAAAAIGHVDRLDLGAVAHHVPDELRHRRHAG